MRATAGGLAAQQQQQPAAPRAAAPAAVRPVHSAPRHSPRVFRAPLAPKLRVAASSPADDGAQQQQQQAGAGPAASPEELSRNLEAAQRAASRRVQRQRQQLTYQVSAIAATTGVSALAVLATYYKFSHHMVAGSDAAFPWLDMAGTLALVVGGVVGMEMWARWAHRALWHDFAPGWALHKSHHEPRVGPFEANDVYAIINAVPAISLCLYGFLTPTMAGSLCFGAGLGITLFGIAYMFVHDGLVHKRFPTGPIAELPYMKRVTVAHRLHHSEKYGGVPFGLFLGPQELEAIGAGPELDRLVEELESRSLAPSRR